MTPKIIQVVGGPNGSGKSTFAEAYLTEFEQKLTYLNPDKIAQGISELAFAEAALTAGRIMIHSIKSSVDSGKSFCFESTLSGKTWVPILKQAKARGYRLTFYFLCLEDVAWNIERIAYRVKLGGHHIPTEIVLRRHLRCFENFWNLYKPLADEWFIFDNSNEAPKLILDSSSFLQIQPHEQKKFENKFLKGEVNG